MTKREAKFVKPRLPIFSKVVRKKFVTVQHRTVLMDKSEYLRILPKVSMNVTNKFCALSLEGLKTKGRSLKNYHPYSRRRRSQTPLYVESYQRSLRTLFALQAPDWHTYMGYKKPIQNSQLCELYYQQRTHKTMLLLNGSMKS